MGVLDSYSHFSRIKSRLGIGRATSTVVSAHLQTKRLRDEMLEFCNEQDDLYDYFLRNGAVTEKLKGISGKGAKNKQTTLPEPETSRRKRTFSPEWIAKREQLRQERVAEVLKLKVLERILEAKPQRLEKAFEILDKKGAHECLLYLLDKGKKKLAQSA